MLKILENNWLIIPRPRKLEKEDDCAKITNKEALVLNTTCQFAEKSTAHGISYIFEDGRMAAERILWALIVIVGLSFRY